MVDYRKWDRLADEVDDDDDDDERPQDLETHAANNPGQALNVLKQQDAYVRTCQWLRECASDMSETSMTNLARYMAVQDKNTCPDAPERHTAVLGFLKEVAPWKPPVPTLAALCKLSETRMSEANDRAEQLTCARATVLAMSSLNTAVAAEREGGRPCAPIGGESIQCS